MFYIFLYLTLHQILIVAKIKICSMWPSSECLLEEYEVADYWDKTKRK